MKLKLALPLVAVAVAAIGYQILQPNASDPTLPDSSPPEVAATETVPEPDAPATSDPGSLPDAADDAETELVYGLRVRKDRNCTVKVTPTDVGGGKIVKLYTCVPNEPHDPEYYESYDDRTLAQLAYADPGAAEELGKRIFESDPEGARHYMIRSVALRPENIKPVLWLADQNYSEIARNGEPSLEQMQEKYLLTRIAEELGDQGASLDMERLLREAGVPEVMFEHLERQVMFDLKDIRDIQIEVNGQSDLPEVLL